MQVISIWKGRELPQSVEVRGSAAATGSIDRRFDVGRTYLVIPGNSREPFLASGCSATLPYTAALSVIPASYQEAIGASVGRPPAGSGPHPDSEAALTRSIVPLLGLIALIAVAWLVISWIRSFSSDRELEADGVRVAPPETFRKPISNRARVRKLKRSARFDEGAGRATRRRSNKSRHKLADQSKGARKANGSTDTSCSWRTA